MESVKENCLLCHNALNGRITKSPYAIKVFNNCSEYLTSDIISGFPKNQGEWNFPFCPVCFQFGEQLFQMHEQLEEMKKEIKDFVQLYLTSALKVRQTLGSSPADGNLSPGASLISNDDSTSNSEVVVEKEVSSGTLITAEDSDIEIKYETRSESVKETPRPNPSPSTSKSTPNERIAELRIFSCEACGRVFTSNYDLQVHFSEHVGSVKMFSCDVCGDGFFKCESLQKHQQEHIDQQTMKNDRMTLHQCEKCPMTFFNEANFLKHKESHNDMLQLRCQVCLEIFESNESLAAHNCKKGYDCPICFLNFRSKIGLHHHEQTLHGRHHKCINCGMQFRSGKEYKEHRQCHLKEPTLCLMCNKTLHTRNNLRQHFLDTHI